MKNIVLALFTLASIALPACSGGGGNADVDAILALDGVSADGSTVYTDKCAVCHMADGSGNAASGYPSLVAEVPGQSDEDIVTIILEGEEAMPAFRSQLSDQQVADVLAYLRETFK
ncbi:MAG TPA: cytochrome c [Nannocystaceae bacterium]|nr:cytochrome c [Nannocystaceae bacterium]